MDELESKIVEILKRGTPLRAAKIADMLGVERREVNHYLYSSLKHLVVQDSDYRWSFKTNQRSNTQNLPTQPQTPKIQSSQPARQENLYSFTKKEIQQDRQSQPQTPKIQPSQPIRQNNPYEVIKRELAQATSEEKVKILENAFRQDQFTELKDEEINALQSILEQSKREVSIANTAYTQGKLSSRKTNPLAIAFVSIALTLATLFVISQLKSNSTYQHTPSIPQSK
ncbi:hypothetical protein NIES4075_46590 [Tolypothrix sp. NIES-4075]|uniref:hypothetical protein n=1 Tax=Tolypothrix sp. NIES-4075 TaxID=2005459 RepID=UPI000B5CA6DC|nr:hypothetical protein [Tolypothrix sp. NIES-4075]GAX43644.1 hypothetical protein NIES4075_46590 [Tolypothrix sp. NIES-4075]